MLIRFLLGVLVVILLLIGLTFWVPGADQPTAGVHPEIPTMLKSNGPHDFQIMAGYGLGICMILLMGGAVTLGLRRKADTGKATVLVRWVFIGYLLVFSALVFSYWQYPLQLDAFFGGFPAPTAWMIYGMWSFPLIIVIAYMFRFNEWFVSHEELEAFRQEVVGETDREGGEA